MIIDFDLLTVLIGIVLYMFICFIISRTKKPSRPFYLFSTVFFIYIMVVIKLTLFPIIMIGLPENLSSSINLVPFQRGVSRSDLLNILMTIPFSIILPFVSKIRNLIKMSLIGFLLGFGIELLQLAECALTGGFSMRVIDITDVICNFLGVVIGYFILYFIAKVISISPSEKGNRFLTYSLTIMGEISKNGLFNRRVDADRKSNAV